MKAFGNLDELEFNDIEDHGLYTSRRALFSSAIGARQLGYNLTELPPGRSQCPFHSHRAEEEMFVILEGVGELRFGDRRFPIKKHDVIACPTGGPSVAHQIINTGPSTLRYLAVSTQFAELRHPGEALSAASLHGQLGLWPGSKASKALTCTGRLIK